MPDENLLRNWCFCDGAHHQDGIPQLHVPDEWTLDFVDGVSFEGIEEGQVGARPESVVVDMYTVSEQDRQTFFQIDGETHRYALKCFKGMAPTKFTFWQAVRLEVGQRYRLRVWVYPDFVASYEGGKRYGDPWDGEVWLGCNGEGQWFAPGHGTLTYGEYNVLEYEFEAQIALNEIEFGAKGKYGLENNGIWVWGAELGPVGAEPPPVEPPEPPPVDPPEPPEPPEEPGGVRVFMFDLSDRVLARVDRALDWLEQQSAVSDQPQDFGTGALLSAAADSGEIHLRGPLVADDEGRLTGQVQGETAFHDFTASLVVSGLYPKDEPEDPRDPGQPEGLPMITGVRVPMRNTEKAWYEAAHHFPPYDVHPAFAFDWNLESGGNSDLGEPLVAPFNGVVMDARDFGGRWGRIVQLAGWLPGEAGRPGRVIVWMGAHLDEIHVEVGDLVSEGDVIGTIGNAGGQYAAHLHEQWCQSFRGWGGVPPATAYPTNGAYDWLEIEPWYLEWIEPDELARLVERDGA